MDGKKVFGEAVRQLCKRKGLTQKAAAERADFSPADVSRYATGEREPRLSQIVRLVQVGLEVPLPVFFKLYEDIARQEERLGGDPAKDYEPITRAAGDVDIHQPDAREDEALMIFLRRSGL